MTTTDIPARNRAIKKLLITHYNIHASMVSVKAGNGTAYHWVYINFQSMPAALNGVGGRDRKAEIENLIRGAGIELSEFPLSDCGEDRGMLPCLNITVEGRSW